MKISIKIHRWFAWPILYLLYIFKIPESKVSLFIGGYFTVCSPESTERCFSYIPLDFKESQHYKIEPFDQLKLVINAY